MDRSFPLVIKTPEPRAWKWTSNRIGITSTSTCLSAATPRDEKGNDGLHEAMLEVEGNMVPVVILGVLRVAMALLLADEVPLLIELDLTRPRGNHQIPILKKYQYRN